MAARYTPAEVAIAILQKTEELTKSAMAGLKVTTVAPVVGVVSPTNPNVGSPTKVGSQAVVKQAKAKKPAGAMDKPSIFYKSEYDIDKGVNKLQVFLSNKAKKVQSV